MKNWRTTLIGAALAVLTVIASHTEQGASLTDWKTYLIPALLALFGYLAKDAGVTGSVKALALLLLPLCLCQCVTQDSTDRELAYAKAGLEAASLTYDLAALTYAARAADPSVSAAEKLVAKRAFEAAQTRLDEASARVQAIIDRRRAEAIALPLATAPGAGPEVLLGERTAAK